MMTEAPERIWRVKPWIPSQYRHGLASWPAEEHAGEGATEYIHADHVNELIAAAYEVAAEKANCDYFPDQIRESTPDDARAALAARDKRVRKEALQEALQRIADLKRGHSEDVDEGHEQAYRTIEALITKDAE